MAEVVSTPPDPPPVQQSRDLAASIYGSIIPHVDFRWNEDNIDHIGEHGVSPAEAEYVVRNARRPYPGPAGEGKWRVRGQTRFGWYLQVIFIKDDPQTLYVIHARPLTDRERRAFRR